MSWFALPALAIRLFLAIAMGAPTAAASFAFDQAYTGTWSRNWAFCDDQPMQITKDGLSGHEFACTTKRAKRDRNGWRIQFSCSAEGTDYTLKLRWQLLENGRLRETIDGKTVEYSRCPDNATPQTKPENFAEGCVACFNEAQQLGRSVGGYCPGDCVDIFQTMTCDSKGICHLPN